MESMSSGGQINAKFLNWVRTGKNQDSRFLSWAPGVGAATQVGGRNPKSWMLVWDLGLLRHPSRRGRSLHRQAGVQTSSGIS